LVQRLELIALTARGPCFSTIERSLSATKPKASSQLASRHVPSGRRSRGVVTRSLARP
jgi:hypothetical protein